MVRFDNMKHISDPKSWKKGAPAPLGEMWKGSCYHVHYSKGTWYVSGYNKRKRESMVLQSSNADPDRYEISLWGRVLKFNEAGELIDKKYGHIGNLHCVMNTRACEKCAD